MNNFEKGYKFTDVNNIQIHYALEGNPKNPTLVLINMASHNLTSWEVVLEDFLLDFQVLRFDGRGTGLSGHGEYETFNFSQYADDLYELLNELSITKAFVLGIAYGARTAAKFALKYPEKLTSLALCDVALSLPVDQTEQANLGNQAREMLKESGETPVVYQKYWRFYKNKESALKFHTAHIKQKDITKDMIKVSVPSLVTCGRQDMNLDEAKKISRYIPNSTFEVMEMTGHASIFFRPKLFSQIVRNFYQLNFGETHE